VISPETIALVRERTDIVALVQTSVPSLKKRGRSWSGLCPFHKERTPSFHVNQDRGFFKCFGCGESGDVITFAMKEMGYTFHEAVRALAERAGIVIEEEARDRTEVDRARKQKDDLYAVNALAAAWFEEQLVKHPLRSFALTELERRGIVPGANAEVDLALKAFRVGYAPADWDALAGFLRQQGVSPVAAESVGLLAPRTSGSGHYDRFRHRLMFAVIDTQGRVVAFSGRALEDADPRGAEPRAEKPAKYINSKESPVYTKGNVLFGLFQARHAIRSEEVAIVVEGNFDVFSLHARGLTNVVAPLGTAFTSDQAALLKRYAPTVVLLFDGDAAGRKATRASRGPCMEAGLVAKVAELPQGEDPDDFARGRGIAPLRQVCAESKGMLEFLIDAELDESFVAADSHERLARVERIERLIAEEHDELARMMAKGHADRIAGRLDLLGSDTFRALEQKIRSAARAPRAVAFAAPAGAHAASRAAPPRASSGTRLSGPPSTVPRAQLTQKTAARFERREIVAALLDYPSLLVDHDVVATCVHLEGPAALAVAALREAWDPQKGLDTPGFLAQIPPAIRDFASDRLAAPVHESEQQAKEALLASAQRLERLILAQDAVDIWRDRGEDADLTKLRDLQERAEKQKGINARTSRTSGLGAAPHEERPFEEAPGEGGRGEHGEGERTERDHESEQSSARSTREDGE
jgi:DNA primase